MSLYHEVKICYRKFFFANKQQQNKTKEERKKKVVLREYGCCLKCLLCTVCLNVTYKFIVICPFLSAGLVRPSNIIISDPSHRVRDAFKVQTIN